MINLPQELIEQTYKEIHSAPRYRKLKDIHSHCLKRRDFIQAMLVAKKMKDYEVSVFEGILRSHLAKKRVSESIVDSMSVEDREKMNILANSMLLMSDVLDAMLLDAKSIINKYTNGRVTNFEKLNELLKETRSLVAYFDKQLYDEKAITTFGAVSDNLYEMIFNKAKSLITKLKKNAERTNKKTKATQQVA